MITRGAYGIETLALLLALKIRYPRHVYLLRGQSESRDATRVFGFYEQCKQRVGMRQYRRFVSVMSTLPLAARVDQRVLCVAGGVSAAHLAPADSLHAQLFGSANAPARAADLPETGPIRDLVCGAAAAAAGVDAHAIHTSLLQPHALELLVTGGRASDHGFRAVSAHQLAVFSATEANDEDNPAAVLRLPAAQGAAAGAQYTIEVCSQYGPLASCMHMLLFRYFILSHSSVSHIHLIHHFYSGFSHLC